MSTSEFRSALELRTREAELRSFQQAYGKFGDMERRTFSHRVGETRQAGTTETGANDGTLQVVGYAAVFGKPSVELRSAFGGFTEYIDRHAFDEVLGTNPDVILTWDHDSRWPLGRTRNGTLELRTDGDGLRYYSRVAPTSYAADLKVLMDGGYLDQSSFLFRVAPGGEDWEVVEDADGNEVVQRTITNVGGLFDVCVCCAGAYPDTSSGIARTLAFEYALELGYIDERKARPSKAKLKAVTDEFRALGDVAWGPEEGVDDLTCDLEALLNPGECCYQFSVCDVAVTLDKAIVCDWDDYSYWVVPFTLGSDNEPTLVGDKANWVQVETAWVTTTEGYEANIQAAKQRRESRMAEGETSESEIVVEVPEVEVPEVVTEETPEDVVIPESEAETEVADATEADAAAEELRAAGAKARLLAEARARISRAKTI